MQLALPALVRPRCYAPDTGDAVLLEDEVREFLERRSHGTIEISGGLGAGKTKALDFLMATLAGVPGVRFFDNATLFEVNPIAAVNVAIFTTIKPLPMKVDLRLQLASWSDDELIEYLLAAHPEACGSVMQRVLAADDRAILQGVPELWTLVLEQMAADPIIERVKVALRRALDLHLQDDAVRKWIGLYVWALQRDDKNQGAREAAQLAGAGASKFLLRAKRFPLLQRMLAAKHAVESLAVDRLPNCLSQPWRHDLINETAQLIASREAAAQPGDESIFVLLRQLANELRPHCQATAASLLHACGQSWMPLVGSTIWLAFAHLDGINWPGVFLTKADLSGIHLSRANLKKAHLGSAVAKSAKFAHASLREASLERLIAHKADFFQADLSFAKADLSNFHLANLELALLEGASLVEVDFRGANLTGANFRGANLSWACLTEATIDQADFSEACFDHANLSGLPLFKACLVGARFVEARLERVDLEAVDLPQANFQGANLAGANLTGSRMPGANFQKAQLRDTGLADIAWEGADLRDADLSGSTFHLGSSRSGKLFTPLASEGTRTGFYTDDYEEQYFKRPEEIRKANLRGADLRGAKVMNVDFYLVDLGDAVCTPDQREHFQRCRAIL